MSADRKALLPIAALVGSLFFAGTSMTHADPLQEQLQDLEGFQVIGHRGASGYAPEHTWASYDRAVSMGVDYLEIDVRMSATGELIAIHDDTLDRTTDGEGPVKERSLEELKTLDAGSWFNEANPEKADDAYAGAKLLTLDEIIDRYGKDVRYYIETKSPEDYPEMQTALVSKLEDEGLVQSGLVVIQSFSQDSLKEVHGLNADIPLVQLLWYYPKENGESLKEWTGVTPGPEQITDADFQAIADYAVGVGPNYKYKGDKVISEDFVDQAHSNDLLVHVFTINKPEEMRELINWGVEGMFTNYPDVLERVQSE